MYAGAPAVTARTRSADVTEKLVGGTAVWSGRGRSGGGTGGLARGLVGARQRSLSASAAAIIVWARSV
jgi:hypothetical protein